MIKDIRKKNIHSLRMEELRREVKEALLEKRIQKRIKELIGEA